MSFSVGAYPSFFNTLVMRKDGQAGFIEIEALFADAIPLDEVYSSMIRWLELTILLLLFKLMGIAD